MESHLTRSFERAKLGQSKCNLEILSMDGMSGKNTRHFYNNLLNMADARYLEIGTWKGSSVCSAMFRNSANVVCIDNWAQFNGPKNEFLNNFNKFKGSNNARFIEADCFKIDVAAMPKFNIYLYDGDHEEISHYKALTHYIHCMDDTFIYVVDDWNWKFVRDGTLRAISDLNLKVEHSIDFRTTNDDTHPVHGSSEQLAWHNGIFACVLTKSTAE
jgi:hypothetical protein